MSDQELELDLYLTPAEVGSILDISPQAIHKICREQGIETREKGQRKHKVYPGAFRKILEYRGHHHSRHRISVHSVKGGVGKTTLVHALASRASTYGFRTLMIDLDKQANLSNSFGLYFEPDEAPTMFEVYKDFKGKKKTIKNAIVPLTDHLHIVPATLGLANFDVSLQIDTTNIGKIFKNLLAPIEKDYDLIILDLSPDFNRVTSAAHCYTDMAVVPVNMDKFSVKGVELTYEHLDYIGGMFEKEIERKIVINKLDARHSLAFEIMGVLGAELKDDLCGHAVPVSKSIENCIMDDRCVWEEKMSRTPALEGFENVLISLLHLEEWQTSNSPSKTKAKHSVNKSSGPMTKSAAIAQ